MFGLLRQIVNDEITVVDTPEEFSARRDYTDEAKQQLPQLLKRARIHSKASAEKVLDAYSKWIDGVFDNL
jgi:hypothetical protein